MKRSTTAGESSKKLAKKQKVSSATSASRNQDDDEETSGWPSYFRDLFKVFKALNTVLAFVSSHKHLATTFPVVRASVEGLLKRPLELSKVAEIKALVPEIVKFAYIPENDLRIHAETVSLNTKRELSPDFTLHSQSLAAPSTSVLPGQEEEEHVLVLEFIEYSRGRLKSGPGLSVPPSMTPKQLNKLVDKRNQRFKDAVDELIKATPEGEVSMDLLQAAARDHIPVNPFAKKVLAATNAGGSQNLIIPEPKDRPSIDDIIVEIQKQSWYEKQIVDRRTFKEKAAVEGLLDEPLSHTIQQALRESRNITSLYYHQTAAINAIAKKKHVIVSTSTASGKSVIYQVPLLKFLEENSNSTAIFIYPTKALAQDQRTALEQLLWACPGLQHIKVVTYDGDTPQDQRRTIRETASVIFTNFDMLHASILPHEELWRTFMKNLKLVAVDELHYYSNLFGSHVAQVIRRFRRICAAVGNQRVIFVSCSATIAKPSQHMKSLFGVDDVEEIVEDGAPSGKKDYIVWDLPYKDPQAEKSGRTSSLHEATQLMIFLMMRGVRVIVFCKVRKACEFVMKGLRQELSADGRLDVLAKVMPYRGGYSQEDRRRIEHEAFSGRLLGIVATNALELGVDIGVLDAVIMLGFPFGIANFRQQAGRAGRRSRDSLAVLIADDLPIDQHYVDYPDELYDQPMDDLIVDVDSKVIIEAHLQCAAHEMPLSKDDAVYFGASLAELCDSKLRKDQDGWYHTHPKFLPYPSRHVSIRGADDDKYTVIDVTKLGLPHGVPRIMEEIELARAIFELYEGGVFMHQGLTFIVKEVSHDTKVARLVRADVNWSTRPRDYTDVDAKQTHRIKEIAGSPHRAYFGRVDVTTVVFGFLKLRGSEMLEFVDVDTLPYERQVTGFWFDVPKDLLGLLREKGLKPAEAIHSASHAWMNRFALSPDLRTECKAAEKELAERKDEKHTEEKSRRKRPARLILYDASRKGSVSAQAFDHSGEVLRQAHDSVEACPCDDGCYKCIHSATCSEGNVVASKAGALLVLKALLNLDIDTNSVAQQPGQGPDTIVEATYVRPLDGVQVEPA
ncbi:DEAD H helicase [Suillus paluster]|uniref:DEAD H helicase n=1 Tax=Suillus paluster TaxID=48578 RepID=UPI001B87A752|nr:DEAD H helicase [Suillus paluster]KAG1749078.1 DEAD H helicase [Suillus paluster]